MKQNMISIHDILNYTCLYFYLFDKVKFIIDKETQLGYTEKKKSYCYMVMKGCNALNVPKKKQWWKIAATSVMHTISRLRNDKNTAINQAFMSKFVCYSKLCVFNNIFM